MRHPVFLILGMQYNSEELQLNLEPVTIQEQPPPKITTSTSIVTSTDLQNIEKKILQTSENYVINCTQCPQKFSEEKDFAFHQQAEHQQPLTFFCAICQKSFEQETSLRHHKIAAHHAGTKAKLECNKCGGYFTGTVCVILSLQERLTMLLMFSFLDSLSSERVAYKL